MTTSRPSRPQSRNDFRIAIICALPHESSAVRAVFDELWEPPSYGKAAKDANTYTTGRIGESNVVLAYLFGMGGQAAANASVNFLHSYPSIRLILVVGICGGAPKGENGRDLNLGDIVIGDSIVRYAYGRKYSDRIRRKNAFEDLLPAPNQEIRGFLHKMKTVPERKLLQQDTNNSLEKLLANEDYAEFRKPPDQTNKLFDALYRHKHQNPGFCTICDKCKAYNDEVCDEALAATCFDLGCNDRYASQRASTSPAIHFGTIASADLVMKSAQDRDQISKEDHAIAFEMEGLGTWDNIPTIIVKSICDYADSHKNKDWQNYAAAAAACCTKSLLNAWALCNPELPDVFPAASEIDVQARDGKPSADKLKGFLLLRGSLWFNEIRKRQDEIIDADEKTFEWIFDAGNSSSLSGPGSFVPWLEGSGGMNMYWMRGKAGSGKSTLMNLITGEPRTKLALAKWSGHQNRLTVATHFFWTYGSDLQNSVTGFLRSIVYQILEAMPELTPTVFSSTEENVRLLNASTGAKKLWTEKTLRRALESLLAIDTDIRGSLCIFVDGLDECLPGGHPLISMLKRIAAFKKTKLCVSSRPLVEYITAFQDGPSLKLEDLTVHDINGYFRATLRNNFLTASYIEEEPDLVELISTQIAERAEGIFLWVRIVTEILVSGIIYREPLEMLLSTLERLPSGVEDFNKLYESMLARIFSRPQAKLEVAVMFQLVMGLHEAENGNAPFADPMTDFAIANHASLSRISGKNVVQFDLPKLVRDAELRIIYLGAGFIEMGKGRRDIRFYHKSALDFLSRPEIWKTIIEPTAKSNFRVNQSLLSSRTYLFEHNLHSQEMRDFFGQINWLSQYLDTKIFDRKLALHRLILRDEERTSKDSGRNPPLRLPGPIEILRKLTVKANQKSVGYWKMRKTCASISKYLDSLPKEGSGMQESQDRSDFELDMVILRGVTLYLQHVLDPDKTPSTRLSTSWGRVLVQHDYLPVFVMCLFLSYLAGCAEKSTTLAFAKWAWWQLIRFMMHSGEKFGRRRFSDMHEAESPYITAIRLLSKHNINLKSVGVYRRCGLTDLQFSAHYAFRSSHDRGDRGCQKVLALFEKVRAKPLLENGTGLWRFRDPWAEK